MERADLSTLIATQETALLRVGSPLHDKLALHTVAVHSFRGPVDLGDEASFASGVLVRTSRRCFLFTSREAVRATRDGKVFLSMGNGDHPLVLDVVGAFEDGTAGVIGLAPTATSSLEAAGRTFLTERGVNGASPARVAARNDWMVVGGFTTPDIPGNRFDGRRAKLRGISAEISRVENGARTPLIDMDVLLPEKALDTRFTHPSLELSGAGCWESGVRVASGNWTPRSVRLVGIVERTHAESGRPRARILSIWRHLALAAALST